MELVKVLIFLQKEKTGELVILFTMLILYLKMEVDLTALLSVDTWSYYKEGNVTSIMRDYNQERNVFNLKGLQPGNPGTVSELKGLSNDGFQDLIKKYNRFI